MLTRHSGRAFLPLFFQNRLKLQAESAKVKNVQTLASFFKTQESRNQRCTIKKKCLYINLNFNVTKRLPLLIYFCKTHAVSADKSILLNGNYMQIAIF